MDTEINNVIYMELNSGPKIANSTCGKMIDVETIDRDSTVLEKLNLFFIFHIPIVSSRQVVHTTESLCTFIYIPLFP